MHNLEINGREYKLPETWKEVTLGAVIKLHPIIQQIPEDLKKIYTLSVQEQTPKIKKELTQVYAGLTPLQQIKLFPKWYGDIIACMAGIPKKVMNQVHGPDRKIVYQEYCQDFILGLIFWPINLELGKLKQFKWNKETLMLPKTTEKMGNELPMNSTTALEFCEASDLELAGKELKGGKWENYKWMIGILCRPKGEEYDEAKALERGKTMDGLTMNIVWEVFFCGIKRINISSRHMVSSLIHKVQKQQRQNQAQG